MTYKETLDFLYSKLPMYQRVGAVAFKKDLTNIFALSHALGDPQLQLRGIHIAGTNGKGSTAHILAAIYRNNRYKTGLYTSPHLVDFRERIRIDGKMIGKRDVTRFVELIKDKIEEIQPSFFEITVAMAFYYFAQEKVEVAIIETGLGGRLDSTNVFIPDLSIITSISKDHMDMLGDTIAKITWEKAGIIKHHIPVAIGLVPDEAKHIISYIAQERQALLFDAISIPHRFTEDGKIPTDLLGDFQQLNLKLSLIAVDALQHVFETDDDRTLDAISRVQELSGLQGRWQIYQKDPLVICDVGHNQEGLQAAMYELSKYKGNKTLILGFVKEKDLDDIVNYFPKEGDYHFVKPNIPRGRDANEVKAVFSKAGIKGKTHKDLEVAISEVEKAVGKDSILFIGGSNFLVADFLTLKPSKIG